MPSHQFGAVLFRQESINPTIGGVQYIAQSRMSCDMLMEYNEKCFIWLIISIMEFSFSWNLFILISFSLISSHIVMDILHYSCLLIQLYCELTDGNLVLCDQHQARASRDRNRWVETRRCTPLWSAKPRVRVPIQPHPNLFHFVSFPALTSFLLAYLLILYSWNEYNLLLLWWSRGEVNWTKSQHVDGLHRVTFFTVICAKRKNFHFYSISFSFKYPFDATRSHRNAFFLTDFCSVSVVRIRDNDRKNLNGIRSRPSSVFTWIQQSVRAQWTIGKQTNL